MHFGQPNALWLLSLAVPVIAFHFYRGRIRRMHVPTLLFWDQIVVEDERASAFRRLRHYITLAMSLAALALLATALADPTVPGLTPDATPVAIVIDTAPELGAREPDGRTRLEIARERARALAGGLGRRTPLSLYDAGGLVEPPTTDRALLEQAILRLPRETPPRPVAQVVESARASQPSATIVVFGARPVGAVDERVRVVPVGTPRPNRSLRSPSLAGTSVVSAVAVNASSEAVDATLVVRNRGQVIVEERLKLGPRESRAVSRALDVKEGAFAELALSPEDAYPADDAVHFVVPAQTPPVVAVVSRGPPDAHLWTALRSLESRTVSVAPDGVEAARERLGEATVWVFDRVDPPPLFDGGFLLVACGELGAELENPRVADWDRRHPVHALVDYSDVVLRRARVVATRGGSPLVLTERGPLAAAGRSMGRAWVQFGFGFGVSEGDLALRPSFPVLLRNALAWLADEGRRAFPREARVGDVLVNRALLPERAATAQVTTATGGTSRTVTVPVERGEVRIALSQPGLVKIAIGARTEWVAVRMAESPDLETLPKESGAPMPAALPWWRDLPWPVVAGALVLLILVAEWWIYQVRG
jgi:hypothetical protein